MNSKLNTGLLVVLIILVGVAIWKLSDKKEEVKNPVGYTQTNLNPNGSDYQPKQNTPSRATTIDMSDKYTATYKTVFTTALQKQANFNGHYVVANYGCGTACIAYGVIDIYTGKAYQGPVDDMGGNVVAPANFASDRYSVNSNLFKAIGYSKIETYKFENGVFTKVN